MHAPNVFSSERPKQTIIDDVDLEQARSYGRRLFERAAFGNPRAFVYRYPSPGLGHAAEDGAEGRRRLSLGGSHVPNDKVAGYRQQGLRQRSPADNLLLLKEAAMENTKKIERITADPDWYEPYKISLGTRVGNLLFVSGQAAVTQDGGETVGAGDFDAQAEQAFANLSKVLENGGSGLADVAKVSIYLTDMGNFPKIVELRERYFTPPYPADTIVEVSSLADPEWLIEIEAIAVVGG